MQQERQGARKAFYYKKSYLKHRLQKDVMEDGIAYIPCKVEGLSDIISKYSVEGCESLDDGFLNFIQEFIEFIPAEYPVVLEIHGPKFTDAEKKLITEVVTAETDYLLGKTEAQISHHRKVFMWMAVGTILSGILVAFIDDWLEAVPREFIYIIFWLFADAFVRYIFIEKFTYNNDKILAGRLASIKVEFVEE